MGQKRLNSNYTFAYRSEHKSGLLVFCDIYNKYISSFVNLKSFLLGCEKRIQLKHDVGVFFLSNYAGVYGGKDLNAKTLRVKYQKLFICKLL